MMLNQTKAQKYERDNKAAAAASPQRPKGGARVRLRSAAEPEAQPAPLAVRTQRSAVMNAVEGGAPTPRASGEQRSRATVIIASRRTRRGDIDGCGASLLA